MLAFVGAAGLAGLGLAWILLDPGTPQRRTTSHRSRADASAGETTSVSTLPARPNRSTTRQIPATQATTAPSAPDDTAPSGALRGLTIAVDAGHNGGNGAHASEINQQVDAGTLKKACDTTGTQTAAGYTEAEYTLQVAVIVQKRLAQAGARVIMVRTTNDGWGPCITERARITNRADAAVSIHADGSLGAGDRGFHVIIPARVAGLTDDIEESSRALGTHMRDAMLASGTGIPESTYLGDHGIDVRDDLGGLNLSDTTKVFIETGNMKSAADMRVLGSAAGRDDIAAAIVVGFQRWAAAR